MTNALTKVREALSRLGSGSKVLVRAARAGDEPLAPARSFQPNADVYENESQFLIMLDLPGVNRNDIDLATDGKQLTVRGSIGAPLAPGHVWQRSFALPVEVDPGKARASYALGVLKVELPKRRAELKPIRVSKAA